MIPLSEVSRKRSPRDPSRVLTTVLEQFAFESGDILATEVYSDPPNQISLTFHAKYGFEQVGSQVVEDGGTKVVAKFLKQPTAQ